MKKFNLFCSIVLLCFSSPLIGIAKAQVTHLEGIAAVVNNKVITLSELRQTTSDAKNALNAQGKPIPKDITKIVLNDLIDKYVLNDHIKSMGITASDADVKNAIAEVAKNNKLSVEQLYAMVEKEGFTKQKYNEQIREQMAMQKLDQQQFGSQLKLTPSDLQQARKQIQQKIETAKQPVGFHIQHLWITVPDGADQNTRKLATEKASAYLTQLKQGADFMALAKANSEEPADWGMRPLNAIPTVFLNQLMTMKKNQISNIIMLDNGVHLIKLVDTKIEQPKVSAKELEEIVQRVAMEDKIKSLRSNWLKEIKASAYIKIYVTNFETV